MQDTTMKVTALSIPALLAGAALIAAAGLAPATALSAEGKQTNSAKLGKPLKEAHDDLNAKKYADAIAKLREAEGIAGKTAYDQHLINDMLGFAYARAPAGRSELPDQELRQGDRVRQSRHQGRVRGRGAQDARGPGVLPEGGLEGHAALRGRPGRHPGQERPGTQERIAAAAAERLREAQ